MDASVVLLAIVCYYVVVFPTLSPKGRDTPARNISFFRGVSIPSLFQVKVVMTDAYSS